MHNLFHGTEVVPHYVYLNSCQKITRVEQTSMMQPTLGRRIGGAENAEVENACDCGSLQIAVFICSFLFASLLTIREINVMAKVSCAFSCYYYAIVVSGL